MLLKEFHEPSHVLKLVIAVVAVVVAAAAVAILTSWCLPAGDGDSSRARVLVLAQTKLPVTQRGATCPQ